MIEKKSFLKASGRHSRVPKSIAKKAIWDHHQLDIRKELMAFKKLEDIKEEDFSKVQE